MPIPKNEKDEFLNRPQNYTASVLFSEFTAFFFVVLSGTLLIWQLACHEGSSWTLLFTGIVFTVSVAGILWITSNPDSVRARQTEEVLALARQMLDRIQCGLDNESAQEVCEMLLPKSAAVAVAITNRETVLGYAGFSEVDNPAGGPIQTRATEQVVETGKPLTFTSAEEIGFPFESRVIQAAIVVPLTRGRSVFGTLKFYYRHPRQISNTQRTIAYGFGDLLSTQLSAEALEEQTKLTTSMELKALQAQINPHFLFNTINTIASFVRTDPERARVLLREFATFYRHTLEDTGDLVALSREVEQTMRYFYFELARFGEDHLRLSVSFDDDVEDMLIPAFLIQPLVENAVRHARPTDRMLTIKVSAEKQGNFLILSVADDGVGMDEAHRLAILHPNSETGLGIAVKNVHDRVEGYFGEGSHMEVDSELGQGTTIRLVMNLDSENLKNLMDIGNKHENDTVVHGQSVADTIASSAAQMSGMAHADPLGSTSAGEVFSSASESLVAAAAASAETVSSAEVRSMNNIAAQSETTGVADKFREDLSHIDLLNQDDGAGEDFEDDDWDYEEEMAHVKDLSDEEWEKAFAGFSEDALDEEEKDERP